MFFDYDAIEDRFFEEEVNRRFMVSWRYGIIVFPKQPDPLSEVAVAPRSHRYYGMHGRLR